MEKVDFKKTYKTLYKASDKKLTVVEAPEFQFLMIDGKGNPNTEPEFHKKIEAIYGVAYTLKFMLKDEKLQPEGYFDFVVPPLETLWFGTKAMATLTLMMLNGL